MNSDDGYTTLNIVKKETLTYILVWSILWDVIYVSIKHSLKKEINLKGRNYFFQRAHLLCPNFLENVKKNDKNKE